MKNLSAQQLVDAFLKRLQDKKEDVARIASFWNGFENWLKFELALELCEGWERRPWSDQSDDGTPLSIGVEHRAQLRTRTRSGAQAAKRVDLWVSSRFKPTEQWHFVELKVAFKNPNEGKQLASCLADLASLRAILDRQAESGIVLLVAVGFDEPDLASAVPDAKLAWIHRGDQARGADSTPSVAVLSAIA